MSERFHLKLTASAGRTLRGRLAPSVASAVVELVTGALLENPHRIGKPLRGDLAGTYTARRGAYRVIYEIDDGARVVTVLRIEHRADVYRPR